MEHSSIRNIYLGNHPKIYDKIEKKQINTYFLYKIVLVHFKQLILQIKLKDEKDHLFCENCAKEKKISINEEKKNDNLIEFFCKFCESKHYIKSWEIAEESNCIIFLLKNNTI